MKIHAEGVAAPLEPSATEKRSMTWGDLPEAVRTLCGNLKPPMQPHEWDNMNISEQRDWAVKQLDISERFLNVERSNHQTSINSWEEAAAVSKNLQQSVEQLCGDLKAIQQDYTNEKKRADGLQEELTRTENYLNGRECARCGYKVSGSDWNAMRRYMGPHSVRCVGCHGAAGAWRPYGIMGLQARILELEKEIAGLRTAQSAATGTESHWRGRDAALREKP